MAPTQNQVPSSSKGVDSGKSVQKQSSTKKRRRHADEESEDESGSESSDTGDDEDLPRPGRPRQPGAIFVKGSNSSNEPLQIFVQLGIPGRLKLVEAVKVPCIHPTMYFSASLTLQFYVEKWWKCCHKYQGRELCGAVPMGSQQLYPKPCHLHLSRQASRFS